MQFQDFIGNVQLQSSFTGDRWTVSQGYIGQAIIVNQCSDFRINASNRDMQRSFS
jgi:hypothetical protein